MIFSVVVLPQPEGQMRQLKLPGFSSKRRSRSTTVSAPSAERKALRSILTSSRTGERAGPTAVDMGFKRLNHHEFNAQHDADEIGRASCRARVCQYVSSWGVVVDLQKKKELQQMIAGRTRDQE